MLPTDQGTLEVLDGVSSNTVDYDVETVLLISDAGFVCLVHTV